MDFEVAVISFLTIASLVCGHEASASQLANGMPHTAVMQMDRFDELIWQPNLNIEDN